MRRIAVCAVVLVAAFLGLARPAPASASCVNAAAGHSWDGGMLISGSSFVAGCSTGISKRAWIVERFQENVSPYRACAPGRSCGWIGVKAVIVNGVPDGQFNAPLAYCWEGPGGFIGSTSYRVFFQYNDGNVGPTQQLALPTRTYC